MTDEEYARYSPWQLQNQQGYNTPYPPNRDMRNTCKVLIDDEGVYLAVGVDRSDPDLANFVRLDVNKTTILMGPKRARALATLLQQSAVGLLSEAA